MTKKSARTAAVLATFSLLGPLGCSLDRSPLAPPGTDAQIASPFGESGGGGAATPTGGTGGSGGGPATDPDGASAGGPATNPDGASGGEPAANPDAEPAPGQNDGSTADPTADAAPPDQDAAVWQSPGEAGAVDAAPSDAGDETQPPDASEDAGSGVDAAVMDPCDPGFGSIVVEETIVVASGETFNGNCQRYTAGGALAGPFGGSEGGEPLFILEDGARLVNVALGWPVADGIHTYGDVTLANIVWEMIGDDALTIKESGTVVIDGGSAENGDNTVFQINAAGTFRVSNFVANDADKFIRQDGGTTFRVDVFIDDCDISDMDESIFRTDSSVSTVTMTDTRYSNIGDALFLGVSPRNITTRGNIAY